MDERARDPSIGTGRDFLGGRGVVPPAASSGRAYTARELAVYNEGYAQGRGGFTPGIVQPYRDEPTLAAAWSDGYDAGRAAYQAAQAEGPSDDEWAQRAYDAGYDAEERARRGQPVPQERPSLSRGPWHAAALEAGRADGAAGRPRRQVSRATFEAAPRGQRQRPEAPVSERNAFAGEIDSGEGAQQRDEDGRPVTGPSGLPILNVTAASAFADGFRMGAGWSFLGDAVLIESHNNRPDTREAFERGRRRGAEDRAAGKLPPASEPFDPAFVPRTEAGAAGRLAAPGWQKPAPAPAPQSAAGVAWVGAGVLGAGVLTFFLLRRRRRRRGG